jgi:hypothetical protein
LVRRAALDSSGCEIRLELGDLRLLRFDLVIQRRLRAKLCQRFLGALLVAA